MRVPLTEAKQMLNHIFDMVKAPFFKQRFEVVVRIEVKEPIYEIS